MLLWFGKRNPQILKVVGYPLKINRCDLTKNGVERPWFLLTPSEDVTGRTSTKIHNINVKQYVTNLKSFLSYFNVELDNALFGMPKKKLSKRHKVKQ